MAKRKSRPTVPKPRIVRIGPMPYKLVYFKKQIRIFDACVKRAKNGLKRENLSPEKRIEFSVILNQWKITRCRARINLFNWFLGHGQEASLEPNRKRVNAAIAKQRALIVDFQNAIGNAQRRRRLKIRKIK